jgi:protein tyrosine phosphatase (PTP) superfamily phosphohydrolase (DUF442 family)
MMLAVWLAGSVVDVQTNAPGVKPVMSAHLENVFSISNRVFSGGSPHNDEGFLELKKLGVRTIISVDGAKPDVAAAQKHGFRYIHMPMGYDGASSSNANRILKAAETAQGPVYVHCHHGKHRGPAAVAVICQGLGIWKADEAVSWMEAAGTSRDYPGLFRMAAGFRKMDEYDSISTSFPEQAVVSGLVDAMVEIDARWDHLRLIQKADYKVPPTHPDVVPAKEALMLVEAYRELRRVKEVRDLGADFLSRLETAEREAAAIHALLKGNQKIDAPLADPLWSKAAQSCAACHNKYRN